MVRDINGTEMGPAYGITSSTVTVALTFNGMKYFLERNIMTGDAVKVATVYWTGRRCTGMPWVAPNFAALLSPATAFRGDTRYFAIADPPVTSSVTYQSYSQMEPLNSCTTIDPTTANLAAVVQIGLATPHGGAGNTDAGPLKLLTP